MTAIDALGRGRAHGWSTTPQDGLRESMTMTATPLVVNYNSFGGATLKRNFFEIQPNGQFGYDNNPSTLSFASGAAADALGLTQASVALDSSPGGALQSAAVFMNNLVQNEYSQFGSFQATWQTLAEWTQNIWAISRLGLSRPGISYTFLKSVDFTIHPAGRIEHADDRPGWHVQRPGRERANDRSARHVQRLRARARQRPSPGATAERF